MAAAATETRHRDLGVGDAAGGGSNGCRILALLAAIRKNLGHEDEGMAVRDLARVFLTDGDDYISEDLKL